MELLSQIGPFAKLSMLVGVGAFGVAIAYAVRPTERKLSFTRAVSLAAIFSAICGFAVGAAMVFQVMAATVPAPLDMARVYTGLAETLLPLFVSFGFLSAAWLLVAAGMLRRPLGH
jgi:hypothetical protein